MIETSIYDVAITKIYKNSQIYAIKHIFNYRQIV